jgi:pimeloyl-ACP methyl ester carboxylesterase
VFVFGVVSHVEMAWQVPGLRGLFERLGRFARLITFDKRGMGMSDRVEGAPTLETRMDDLGAVMDAVGSEWAALMGLRAWPCAYFSPRPIPDRTGALVLYRAAAARVAAWRAV